MAATGNGLGSDFSTIGVVGAGVMGRGIAQLAAEAGHNVLLFDTASGAATRAVAFAGAMIIRGVESGRLTPSAERPFGYIQAFEDLALLAPAGLVIEAIAEQLEAKQALLRELEAIVAPEAVLATNTSSLPVAAIAGACGRPERVAGLHFFNPPPLMRVVEVVPTLRTLPAVTEALTGFVRGLGHRPILARDWPGFLVNRIGRGLVTEGLQVALEGVAAPADIDRVMREAAGFRMGPFGLMDLTGLDVSHPVMEQIHAGFYQEPRYRPSPITAERLAAGRLGRKSGQGFYPYSDGKAVVPAEPAPPDVPIPPVWVSPHEPERAAAVRAAIGGDEHPSEHSLLLVTPLGGDATTAALAEGLDPRRTVAVDTLFPLDRRRTLMPTPATAPAMLAAAHALFARDGGKVTVIRDSAGFIAQRVVSTIINIAADIAQQRAATPPDIDAGAELGLGYPVGPLALGDRLGPAVILQILEAMQAASGDPRYRPSLWLRRRARLGLSLLQED